MSKLNANAKLWVKALKSGKYTQTHGVLADKNGYCCLGVACEVYNKKVGGLQVKTISDGKKIYGGQSKFLPAKVQRWLGLETHAGGYSATSLITHNDDKKWKFKRIAELIESMPEGLFK